MDVLFQRTGERRYAVVVHTDDGQRQVMDPAPGFDPHIPHDLVHYVVEAQLGMRSGVFGRAARGGGTFIPASTGHTSPRERARARRRQLRREASLGGRDSANQQDLANSERFAAICDLFWRRQRGQQPDTSRPAPNDSLSESEARRVARVVSRLEALAVLWSALPAGGALAFSWPNLTPRVLAPTSAGAVPAQHHPASRRHPTNANSAAHRSERRN